MRYSMSVHIADLDHAAAGAPPIRKSSFWALAIGAVGVVYGDIGTSPLYAMKESLNAARNGGEPTAAMISGVLSLMLWA
ncbi:MAG: KUP/HAK/KT family potassium transporter, partial [Hyphomicrobium sp.]